MPLDAIVPSIAFFASPLAERTVWSTMIDPPMRWALPPACSYWFKKLTASSNT